MRLTASSRILYNRHNRFDALFEERLADGVVPLLAHLAAHPEEVLEGMPNGAATAVQVGGFHGG